MPTPQKKAAAPQRPAPPPAEPEEPDHEVYDDDGATEVISRRPAMSVRPTAPKPALGAAPRRPAPAPSREDFEEPQETSRTVFEPNISAIRAGIVTRGSSPPNAIAPSEEPPVEPTQAIDLVRRPGEMPHDEMVTLQPPAGRADASGRIDLSAQHPPMGMAPQMQTPSQMTHMPGIGPVFAQPPQAPQHAPPTKTSPLLYVFVGVSVCCLVATLILVFARG